MLNELKFVQGAVARKDFQPALTHFHIQGGKIQGYNGILSLCSPIALDIDVTPNAVQLVKAVRNCKDTIALSVTSGGRLAIKSGNFKAFVDCYAQGFPEIRPSGKQITIPPDFLDALKVLEPCIAEDASRQWARGILFRGRSVFATNNVVLLEYFLGTEFPAEINLPQETVRELLRIGELPESALFDEAHITFQYSGDRWLRSQVYSTQWPDVSKVLDRDGNAVTPVLQAAHVEELLPFVDEGSRLYLLDGVLATAPVDGAGARIEIPGLLAGGIFNAHMLRLALERAQRIDLAQYPAPCIFYGNKLRGALIGMRPDAC